MFEKIRKINESYDKLAEYVRVRVFLIIISPAIVFNCFLDIASSLLSIIYLFLVFFFRFEYRIFLW